jgi:hypothetical protein
MSSIMLAVLALTVVSASSSSSSSSSTPEEIEVAGEALRPSQVVQFGSSFRFYKEENTDTFQNSVAHCMSLTIRHGEHDAQLGGSNYEFESWLDGGFRVCYDRELISINRYKTSRTNTPLDGEFWTGDLREQDDHSESADFRMNAATFTNGTWSPFITIGDDNVVGVNLVTDSDDIDAKFKYFCCSSRNNKAELPGGIAGEYTD